MRLITFIGNFIKNALSIDQNTDNIGVDIDSEATTEANAGIRSVTGQGAAAGLFTFGTGSKGNVWIAKDPAENEGTVWIYRNSAAADTGGPLLFIEQDEATDDQEAVKIQQDGPGYGLYVDQNGDNNGIIVTSAATTNTQYALQVSATGGCRAIQATQSAEEQILNLQKLTSGAQTAVSVRNEGTGPAIYLDQNGDGFAIQIASASTVCAPIRIGNLASDPTGAHQVGDLAVVGGKLKICTSAGTPGTWTVVGTQT